MTTLQYPSTAAREATPPREDLIALVRTGGTPGLGVTRHGSRSRDLAAFEAVLRDCGACLLRKAFGRSR